MPVSRESRRMFVLAFASNAVRTALKTAERALGILSDQIDYDEFYEAARNDAASRQQRLMRREDYVAPNYVPTWAEPLD